MHTAFVLGIELHGESTVVKFLVPIIPAMILAWAAWKAAGIAKASASERQEGQLRAAWTRQREQLRDAAKRQKESLAHDRDVRASALAHDRAMRDRDYIRQAVAGALENALETIERTAEYAMAVLRAERTKLAADVEGDEEVSSDDLRVMQRALDALDEMGVAREKANAAVTAGFSHSVRLRLLLGKDDAIVETHVRLISLYSAYVDAVDFDGEPRSDDQRTKEEVAQGKLGSSLQVFEDACRTHFDT